MAIKSHPLGQIYLGIRKRCEDLKATGYANYGGRGIAICEQWRNFNLFVEDVLNSIGERPSLEHTLDRIDNNRNYEPGNVRWATKSEQSRNKRNNRILTSGGESHTLQEWAVKTGIPKSTLFNRILRGWPDQNVVSIAPHNKSPDYTVFPPGGYVSCKRLGKNPETIKSRLRRGWSLEDALDKPVHANGRSIDRYAKRKGPQSEHSRSTEQTIRTIA